jgi:NAD(P)H-nitrite reductase large subunit
MKHVIIGVGAAGVAAAKTIRNLRPDDEIVCISTDREVHSRCMLHHYISGGRSLESLNFAPDGLFESPRLTWLGGVTVKRIDAAAGLVHTDSGGPLSYGRLLIATGAVSAVPPVGALRTATNVFGLRDIADAKAIVQAASGGRRAVVIGAGFVGLDAACGLLELGGKVTVVGTADSVLPQQLDEHAAAVYQARFEAHGCAFRLGAGASGTESDPAGKVTAVLLGNGERLPCDFVVAATGVRPAVDWVRESGIEAERAVKVDEGMRTSAPGVYAAGDVTGLAGIWPNAVKQGEVAARNMCGQSAVYDDTYALKNTVNFYGLQTLSVGSLAPAGNDLVLTREDNARYEKLVIRDGVVKGVLLQGDIGNSGFWQYLIKNKIDVSGHLDNIWRLSYTRFYGLEENGEYRYAAAATV